MSAPVGNTDTRDILIGARKLIERPGAWTKKYAARTQEGWLTAPNANDACMWCVHGAILKVARDMFGDADGNEIAWGIAADLSAGLSCLVGDWNDLKTTKHGDALALLDTAIEAFR